MGSTEAMDGSSHGPLNVCLKGDETRKDLFNRTQIHVGGENGHEHQRCFIGKYHNIVRLIA